MSRPEAQLIGEAGQAPDEAIAPPHPQPSDEVPPAPNAIPVAPYRPDIDDRQALSPDVPWLLGNRAFREPGFFEEWQKLLADQRAELFPPEFDEE